ncbi:hypothetical protein BJ085DRAFT_36668 [Dimargaris cristalligena]|uniref:DUF4604 domain-containing protein n=1 Tax=Dimargaris cristalligena TaxID=215637 RepID=A0A4P9ZMC8_9FUNG|nr:hypothetical protein BJ085DRAFT_36668 [Dimargaris cristalligena]|eukprot:RKP34353.1 hypothetical protein BJ085DRAFT_36668 [Dimargaris cristalligena]
MPPKKLTPHQMRQKGLTFQQETPTFLRNLYSQLGMPQPRRTDSYAEDDAPANIGQVPGERPLRAFSTSATSRTAGSMPAAAVTEEDSQSEPEDEKPQIVVVNPGRDLSAKEVETFRLGKRKGAATDKVDESAQDDSAQPPERVAFRPRSMRQGNTASTVDVSSSKASSHPDSKNRSATKVPGHGKLSPNHLPSHEAKKPKSESTSKRRSTKAAAGPSLSFDDDI